MHYIPSSDPTLLERLQSLPRIHTDAYPLARRMAARAGAKEYWHFVPQAEAEIIARYAAKNELFVIDLPDDRSTKCGECRNRYVGGMISIMNPAKQRELSVDRYVLHVMESNKQHQLMQRSVIRDIESIF